MAEFIRKAVKSAADFNSQFMRELRDDRKAYYDLQTQVSNAGEQFVGISRHIYCSNVALLLASGSNLSPLIWW
jgi:hypothetical protein